MRVLVLFAAAVAVALAADIEKDEGVVIGTDANLAGVIADNEHVLVEFYAPWCGHCKSLAPEYAKAATTLAEQGSAVVLVKVDATVEEKSAEKYGVQGYPTIKFFVSGKPQEFQGGRTGPEIVSWLKKKSGPPATTVTSVEEAKKFLGENDVAIVGIFADVEGDEAKAFLKAAAQGDMMYAITTSADVAAEYGVEAPKIVLFKTFDEPRVDYDGEFAADDINKFATGNSMPLVMEFTDEAAPKIFGGEIKTHLLLFAKTSEDSFAGYKEALTETAKANKGDALFIYIDTDKEDNMRILEFFGLDASDVPAVRLINMAEDMAKFQPESSDITVEALSAFVKGFKDGTLKRHLNSEDTPEDWDALPVKILTGHNFAEVVLDTSKNVLVEFYAPWCGHCKQLAPIWDKLGEKFEDVESVVVAKMDSTANEVESVSVQSFPTLKFFPAGEGEVEDYEGGRTLADFVEFLNEKAGASVTVTDEEKAEAAEAGAGDEEAPEEDEGEDGEDDYEGDYEDDGEDAPEPEETQHEEL